MVSAARPRAISPYGQPQTTHQAKSPRPPLARTRREALLSRFCSSSCSKSRAGSAEHRRCGAWLATPSAASHCRQAARAWPGHRQLRARGPMASDIAAHQLLGDLTRGWLGARSARRRLQPARGVQERSVAPFKVLLRVPDGTRASRIQLIGEQHCVCGVAQLTR